MKGTQCINFILKFLMILLYLKSIMTFVDFGFKI